LSTSGDRLRARQVGQGAVAFAQAGIGQAPAIERGDEGRGDAQGAVVIGDRAFAVALAQAQEAAAVEEIGAARGQAQRRFAIAARAVQRQAMRGLEPADQVVRLGILRMAGQGGGGQLQRAVALALRAIRSICAAATLSDPGASLAARATSSDAASSALSSCSSAARSGRASTWPGSSRSAASASARRPALSPRGRICAWLT
jgi:hypothetical protein